jgi:hypothetical protein
MRSFPGVQKQSSIQRTALSSRLKFPQTPSVVQRIEEHWRDGHTQSDEHGKASAGTVAEKDRPGKVRFGSA